MTMDKENEGHQRGCAWWGFECTCGYEQAQEDMKDALKIANMRELIKKLGEAGVRIRVNWRGKLILQVSKDVPVNYDPRTDNHKPKYCTVWRDACVADLFT